MMDEDVELPVAAPHGAFELTGSNQMCNKLRTSIMKSFGRHEAQPQTATPTLVLILIISLLKPFSASATHFDNTSFNFPSFGSENLKLLNFQRNASVLSPYLHLSLSQPNQSLSGTSGRATYSGKVHLWDKATGNEADFTAGFMFSINSQHRNNTGLTFFVAPWGLSMPGGLEGGQLGLPNDSYVTVEVDTFKNLWDPDASHLGVDVNDLRSVANVTVSWLTNKIMNGGLVNASIKNDSQARNLSVVLMDVDNSSNSVSLYYAPLSLRDFLSERVEVGFSATTGAAYEYHIVHSWEFSSSLRLRGGKFPNSWWNWRIIVRVCVIGSAAIIVIVMLIVWVRNRSKVARPYPSNDTPMGNNAPSTAGRGGEEGNASATLTEKLANLGGPKNVSYEELRMATNSFASDQKLGEGGFRIVYKGHIGEARTRTPVAVKKITSGSRQGIEEYISEVKSLSQLGHINLVQLKGYCHESHEFILVYEFIGGGSLDDHLFKRRPLLTWERRYNIALGLAPALQYLHKQFCQCVIHRDIKSSNVMLDKKFVAKLGDFGMAKLVDHARVPNTTRVKGTPGYWTPEYVRMGKASKKSDIYSFGAVLLEILCGRRVSDSELAEQGSLVRWVWKRSRCGSWWGHWFWNPHLPVDERLGKDFDKKQAKALMILGPWCSHPIASSRPSIEEVMAVLNSTTKPPNLPSKMPSFNI